MIALVGFASFTSCCKDDELVLNGTDCSIISFDLVDGQNRLAAQIYPESLLVIADINQDFSALKAEVVVSEGAIIEPDPATVQDWSKPMNFKVTAANGLESREYAYEVQLENFSQYCTENIYLTTQKEVDEFGTHGYTKAYSIIVNDSEESQITDLSPLKSLITIDKNLTIKNFHGKEIVLDQLKSVSTFEVFSNTLETLSAAALTEVNNLYIGFISEDVMTPVMGSMNTLNFKSLERVKGNMILMFNNQIQDYAIQGFDNLKQLDGDTWFNFPSANLKTFSKLEKALNFKIGGNVKSFEGFENFKTIDGIFMTEFLRGAESLLPFAPTKVSTVCLSNSQTVNTLDFCKNLTEVDNFEISGAYPIKNLKGIETIKRINYGLFIKYTQIENLNELSNLEYVGRTIMFKYNNKLVDYSGLKKCLEDFDGEWIVEYNMSNPPIKEIIGE